MAADLEHRSPDATSQWGVGSTAAAAAAGRSGGGCNSSTNAGVAATGGTGGTGSGVGRRWPGGARGRGDSKTRLKAAGSIGRGKGRGEKVGEAGGPGHAGDKQNQKPQQQYRLDCGDRSRRSKDREAEDSLGGCSAGSSAGGLDLRRGVERAGEGGSGRRRSERRRRGQTLETMDTDSSPSGGSQVVFGAENGGSVQSNRGGSGGMGLEEEGGGADPGGTKLEARGEEGVAARPAAARLAYKLSVSLIDTYKLINQRYYAEKQRQQEQALQASSAEGGSGAVSGVAGPGKAPARQGGVYNHGMDDENFDYIVHEGEVFKGRYSVRETIGKGSFGKVYKSWDEEERKWVALKVIKSKKPFTMQARVEVEILELLRSRDPEGKYNCARMLDHFMTHNHQCLVFEILSFNLYELLRSTQFQGVSLNLVRRFARHLLRALAFLSLPQVDVIHCDLKPENILLQHAKRSNIKVIDFGSSCRSNNKMYSYIQSRFYRSPEVMLGLPYTTAIDMWSLGCILVEMHTGEPLFAGVDQFDQMCRIVSVLGMTPSDVVERSPARGQFFEVDDSSDDGEAEAQAQGEKEGTDGDSCDEGDQSPGLARKTRSPSKRRNPIRRRRRRNESLPDAGVSTRGRGGGSGAVAGAGTSSSTEEDDGDRVMADYCPTSSRRYLSSPKSDSSTTPARPANGYRLRKSLLLKRARKHGVGGGGVKVGGESGSGGAGNAWHLPRMPLADIIGVESGGPSGRREGETGHDPETYALFVNLMERMLDQRPESRITPAEALLHPFLVDPLSSNASAPPSVAQAERKVDSWFADGSMSVKGAAPAPPPPPHPSLGGARENRLVGNLLNTPDGMQSELSVSAAAAGSLENRGNGCSDGGSDNVNAEGDARAGGEGLVSSTSPSMSQSPHRPRSAPGCPGVPGGGGSGSGNSGSGNASRHRRCRVGVEASAPAEHPRTNCTARGRRRAPAAAGQSGGGKSSGGGCSSGGGRGGGKGVASGSTRGRSLRRGRSGGLLDQGGLAPGPAGGSGSSSGVVHWDVSTKRPGRRREAGGTAGGSIGAGVHEGVVGEDVRLAQGGVVEGVAAESGPGTPRASDGHAEAASRVAQLSLHSSGTGRRGRRGTSTARRQA